jgi:hypothetical protein
MAVNRTATGTRDPGSAAPLTAGEQSEILENDEKDVSPRAAAVSFSGKTIRAIPTVITKGGETGTTVEVRRSDFHNFGIDHDTITFDSFRTNYTLPVGEEGGVSQEAADFLTKNFPTSFEYMGG